MTMLSLALDVSWAGPREPNTLQLQIYPRLSTKERYLAEQPLQKTRKTILSKSRQYKRPHEAPHYEIFGTSLSYKASAVVDCA